MDRELRTWVARVATPDMDEHEEYVDAYDEYAAYDRLRQVFGVRSYISFPKPVDE